MTASVLPYSRETFDGDLPAGFWAAGLALSLAIHFLILVYGLPVLSPSDPADEPTPLETEVILETGGPVFDSVASVETGAMEVAPAEPLETVNTAEPDTLETLTAEQAAQTIEAETVAPTTAELAVPVPEVFESAAEPTVAPLAETLALTQPEPAAAPVIMETVTPPEVEPPASIGVVEAIEAVEAAEPLANMETVAAEQTSPADPSLAVIEGTPVDAIVAPSETAGTVDTLQVVTALQDVRAEPEELPVTQSEPVQVAQEVVAAVDVEPPAPDLVPENAIDQLSAVDAAPALAGTAAVDVASGSPVAPPDVVSAPATAVETVTAEVPEAVLPEPSAPEPILVEQQIASVDPLEGVNAIAPADLEPEPVAIAPDTSVEAETVAPADVETLDPTERVASYVADYKLGECAHLTVQSAGADTALITAFGASIAPFVAFDQRFRQDQGFDASIEVRIVTQPQCQLLNTLGFYQGIEVADLISLNKTVVRSGAAVSGVIGRDLPIDKIAVAEQNGVDLTGRGPPELYLVDDAGQIHDGRAFILPHTDPGRAGGWNFSIPVTMLSAGSEETALVLAVWNRPKGNQPGKFGKLPASRISYVLEQPGVYSLAAFKVTR